MSGGRALEVYVDTNGWSDLFRARHVHREMQLRRDLRAAARSGRFRFLTSGWAIEELGGIADHDWAKYRRVLRFLFDLVGDGLLLESRKLIDAELNRGRRLRGRERFIAPSDVKLFREATARPDLVREASAERRARAKASALDGRARRERSLRALAGASDGETAQSATIRWYASAAAWTEQWARDVLKDRLQRLGRDPAVALTYPLGRVPTAQNFVAETLARIVWNVGHGRQVDEGDDADTHHYAAACYADVFVSGDAGLAQIIGLIPDAGVRPMSLLDFARTELGWSRFKQNVAREKVTRESDPVG